MQRVMRHMSLKPWLPQVLQDPRQKRFFKAKDMSDLFTLGSEYAGASETAAIFGGIDGEVLPDAAAEPPPDGATAAAAESPACGDPERTPARLAGPSADTTAGTPSGVSHARGGGTARSTAARPAAALAGAAGERRYPAGRRAVP